MGTRRVADDDTFDMDTPVDCTVEVDTEEEEPRVALHHTWDTSSTLTSTWTWVGDCWNTDVMPRVGGTASEPHPAREEGEHAHTHARNGHNTRDHAPCTPTDVPTTNGPHETWLAMLPSASARPHTATRVPEVPVKPNDTVAEPTAAATPLFWTSVAESWPTAAALAATTQCSFPSSLDV